MSSVGSDPFLLLQILGTVAFAVSGGAVAVRTGMDWLGVVVLAVVTAVGGGTLRDLLVGNTPVSWIADPWPVLVAVAAAVVVIAAGHRVPHLALDSRTTVLVADAAGLAAFTVTGTTASLAAGVPGGIAAVLGVVTGAGGGVIRDVLARERPLILVGEVYAVAALLGAGLVVVLADTGAPDVVTRWSAVVVILAVRLAAIHWHWTLPRFPPLPEPPG